MSEQEIAHSELLLFSVDPQMVESAVAAGVDGIIVDWENQEKKERQNGSDTEINRHTLDDLRAVRMATKGSVICRINGFNPDSASEIETAVDAGADEILLPMVRTVEEVEFALDIADSRCGTGILVETVAALSLVTELSQLPLDRIYVGLNDLAIERDTPNIFTAVADGTLAQIRSDVNSDMRFGFGGLTLPDRGRPIPCRLLIAEMARLNCSFSFLRRSFHRDTRDRDLEVSIAAIRAALASAAAQDDGWRSRQHSELCNAIESSSTVETALAAAVPGGRK